jgi:hypothetical protein
MSKENICLRQPQRDLLPTPQMPGLESVLLQHVGVRHHRAGRNDAPRHEEKKGR